MFCHFCLHYFLNNILNFYRRLIAMKEQAQTQFRDIIFMNRIIIPQLTRKTHPSPSLAKVFRSTWTKKVIRQKQSEQKLKTIDNFFKKSLPKPLPSFNQQQRIAKQVNNSLVSVATHDKKTSRQLQSNNSRELKQKTYNTSHFAVNRNVYNQDLHEDISKSGILFQKLQNEPPSLSPPKKTDPRKILKNIKLKSSNNFYKGNFARFTKRDIINTIKTRRFHLTNDLDVTPWQHIHIEV